MKDRTMAKLVIFILASILLTAGENLGQTGPGQCSGIDGDSKFGFPKESPVVYGEELMVPAVKLTFVGGYKGQVEEKTVVIRYTWEWFEYPYQDDVFGAWQSSYEVVRCKTNRRGLVMAAEYVVRPRGWSKLTGQRRTPKFKGLETSLVDDAGRSFTFFVPAKKLKGDQLELRFSLKE